MTTKIYEVRERLNSALTEYKSIVSKEADLPTDEVLPSEDTDRLAVLEKDIAVLQARVARLEAADALPEASDAEVVDDTDEKAMHATGMVTKQFAPARPGSVYPVVATQIDKGLRAARFLIATAFATKHGTRAAADMIHKNFNDDMVSKAIMSVASTGSTVIPTFFSSDLIELLRPLVAVRNAGAMVIDTTGGNLTIPRMTQAATAQWQSENADILTSNEVFDDVVLSNHKLTAMVPVSFDLIARSPIGMDAIVRDDLVQVLARAEDLAFLTSTGSGGSPTGLRAQSGIQTMYAAGSDLTSVIAAIIGAKTKLQMANTRMIRPVWFMSPMTRNFLGSLRDGLGNFFTFKDEIDRGQLSGYPIFTSTQLTINNANYITGGTTGTHGADMFLVDMADVIIGDTLDIRLEASNQASYFDGTALQSAWSKDLILFRAIKETDLVLRHPGSVVNVKTDSWTLY